MLDPRRRRPLPPLRMKGLRAGDMVITATDPRTPELPVQLADRPGLTVVCPVPGIGQCRLIGLGGLHVRAAAVGAQAI